MTTKQEYNKKMKQLAIMQAAESIFLKKPYGSITVNEIAKKAGVTKRTLYNYFPSKLALFVRMFENYLQELHRRILAVDQEELTPDRKLFKILEVQFSFSMENQDFMRLFWTLDSDEFDGVLPEELARSIHLWNRNMIDIGVRVVRDGQRKGVISPCEPEMLVHMMSAFNKGIVIHTNKEAKLSIADVDGKQLHQLFFNLVSKGLFIGPPMTT
jgi:TetR/AcrR family fatty acid metabolism transcriptional regulator